MTSAGAAPRYRPVSLGGSLTARIDRSDDGVWRVTSTEPLRPYPARLTDSLLHWAERAPDRTLVAKRVRGGDWRRVSYAEAVRAARSIAQALLDRKLSADRPLAILSDNDIEHLLLALGAMLAGVPYAPVSPAYSLVSQDHGKLKHIVGLLTPGLVFASGPAYAKAIAAAVPAETPVVLTDGELAERRIVAFAELTATGATAAVDEAHARVGPDTIAKFLFTSGSTKLPKGVVNTQRMLCANQQMIRQCFPTLAEEPPVLVDWLPWNHTFGGNHNTGLTIYNGGTLHIDEGKPTPALIGETLRNLREIAPTIYFNVPKGFEEIANALEVDETLRTTLFSRVRMFFFSGAGLAQPVWDKLERVAEQACGERIRMLTGLGMTETAPFAICANAHEVKSGHIGLPAPGVEMKLVPSGGKLEVRYRGPNVTPGYWRAPEQTAESFDEEGFFCSGDAAKPMDPADPGLGFVFDGRIAEDFKLSTGTFVSVGPLRARIIAAGDPLVQDVVIAGINRSEIGVLFFMRIDACRAFTGLPDNAPPHLVLGDARVRAFLQRLVDTLHSQGTGSATRVARALVLAEPPSIDRGEITDKGSINQRAVLQHRDADVVRMYLGRDRDVILPRAA
ncbi:MAG TPA: feruloyl-CoA synthase [Caldimonas sp.]|jgi:feruloyl-CoA synthase|nr:feruloyl-CoA synthase [Caldimonas sp.]HEX2539453.1 feruloyl-CoA synthase [Caldimonas sp.]